MNEQKIRELDEAVAAAIRRLRGTPLAQTWGREAIRRGNLAVEADDADDAAGLTREAACIGGAAWAAKTR